MLDETTEREESAHCTYIDWRETRERARDTVAILPVLSHIAPLPFSLDETLINLLLYQMQQLGVW
jgi:hypothetical protein